MNNLESLLRFLIKPGVIEPEIDPSLYRSIQPDLELFSNDELRDHFDRHGRDEGRIASAASHRYGFVAQIPKDCEILEIGPAHKPVLAGANVRYFDVLPREGLLKKAMSEGFVVKDCPKIDYVSPTADLGVVDRLFDGAFSSHCIEHQPDLIFHIQQLSKILREGGCYYLIIPDKRYCFDATLRESVIEDVLEAHQDRRRVHTIKSIFDHFVRTTHNDPSLHWQGDSIDPRADQHEMRTDYAVSRLMEAKKEYIDVHAWQFTPEAFRSIINNLYSKKFIDMSVERVYSTVYGRNEFCAILKKQSLNRRSDRAD